MSGYIIRPKKIRDEKNDPSERRINLREGLVETVGLTTAAIGTIVTTYTDGSGSASKWAIGIGVSIAVGGFVYGRAASIYNLLRRN
jgi:hypothetical protein